MPLIRSILIEPLPGYVHHGEAITETQEEEQLQAAVCKNYEDSTVHHRIFE